MFKPAEEMVYIGLDEESRTKGKAAIDVVGAQSGKSLGSVLQQALLLATGGALAGARANLWGLVSHKWGLENLCASHGLSWSRSFCDAVGSWRLLVFIVA